MGFMDGGDMNINDMMKLQMLNQAFQGVGGMFSQMDANRRGVPYQGGQGGGGGTADMARMMQLQLMMKESQAKEDERKRKLASAAQIFGPYSPAAGGVPWTNPDTGQVTNGGGLLDKLPLSPDQRQMVQAAGLMDADKAVGLMGTFATQEQKAPTLGEFFDSATGQPYKAQYNPATKAWDRVGGAKGTDPDKAPTTAEFFDPQTGQPYKAQYNPQTRAWDRIGGTKAMEPKAPTMHTLYDEQGREQPAQYDPTTKVWNPVGGTKVKEANDTERTAATYADRMHQAEAVLAKTESQGTNMAQAARSAVPVLGNRAISEDRQKYEQAQRNFVNAVLRKESGAVISDEEFANAKKQYFPQPGDTPQVIEQKRDNRRLAREGMSRSAGPNYKAPKLPGDTGGWGIERLP